MLEFAHTISLYKRSDSKVNLRMLDSIKKIIPGRDKRAKVIAQLKELGIEKPGFWDIIGAIVATSLSGGLDLLIIAAFLFPNYRNAFLTAGGKAVDRYAPGPTKAILKKLSNRYLIVLIKWVLLRTVFKPRKKKL